MSSRVALDDFPNSSKIQVCMEFFVSYKTYGVLISKFLKFKVPCSM